jgi:hypothetical protein
MRWGTWLAALVVGGLMAGECSAAPLLEEDFEVNPSADWTVNAGVTDSAANFFFDYSTVGIPSAPNSVGGTTRGLKLQANLSSGVFGGFSVSPTGLALAGDYTVSFDWWSNFNGPFPAGGSGSTNLSTFGVGTAGNSAQSPGFQDSVMFAATGDGNSASDWRAYSSVANTSYPDGDPVYEADTRNGTDPYYAGFGNVAAPAAQVALFPQQAGNTGVGSAGMEWHEVLIRNQGGLLTWRVDGLLLASVDLGTVDLGGDNIFFGHSDTNATSSSDANDTLLLFTLIDNVRVVPEPGTLTLALLGILFSVQMGLRRRRK